MDINYILELVALANRYGINSIILAPTMRNMLVEAIARKEVDGAIQDDAGKIYVQGILIRMDQDDTV